LFANCQQFDLTANRNNVRSDQEEYELALHGIKDFCKEQFESDFVKRYFEATRAERENKEDEEKKKSEDERKARAREIRKERLNKYKSRSTKMLSRENRL